MKYKITPILFSFLLAFAFSASAQNEIFKILAASGNVKVIHETKTDAVSIGKKLYKNDKVELGSNSYLGLAHSSGKTLEIKKAGVYEISQLAAKLSAQDKSACKKYVDFVVGEMTAQNDDLADNKRKYMSVTGSVYRGGTRLESWIPGNSKIIPGLVTLFWHSKDTTANEKYVVSVFNLFDKLIIQDTVNENEVVLDLSKVSPKPQPIVYWEVHALNNKEVSTGKRAFKVLSQEEGQKATAEINEVKKELHQETALNSFVLAKMYEDKELLADAAANYEKTVKLAPSVEMYNLAYKKFIAEKVIPSLSK